LARAVGVSKNSIHRAWHDQQLKPHLTKTFKLSRDPEFIEKLTDVVGWWGGGGHLQQPKDGVVLCVDEKSQIQALDRSQPGLPRSVSVAAAGPSPTRVNYTAQPVCLGRFMSATAGRSPSNTRDTAIKSSCAFCAGSTVSFHRPAACT